MKTSKKTSCELFKVNGCQSIVFKFRSLLRELKWGAEKYDQNDFLKKKKKKRRASNHFPTGKGNL